MPVLRACEICFQSVTRCSGSYHCRQPTMLATERRAAPALTQLNEEESMFQATVRKFARERIAPHVREMDDAGVFRKELLREFFELGLMAIDVPEEYGGAGGYLFQSILAVEGLATDGPPPALIVAEQKTRLTNANAG